MVPIVFVCLSCCTNRLGQLPWRISTVIVIVGRHSCIMYRRAVLATIHHRNSVFLRATDLKSVWNHQCLLGQFAIRLCGQELQHGPFATALSSNSQVVSFLERLIFEWLIIAAYTEGYFASVTIIVLHIFEHNMFGRDSVRPRGSPSFNEKNRHIYGPTATRCGPKAAHCDRV